MKPLSMPGKKSLQLRTFGAEFGLHGCGWTPTTGPALAARLYANHLCRDLPCPADVQWHVPQWLEHWSNVLSANQFVGGSMLSSWDLMPNDSDGVAYLNPWCLGTVKASLRFAKPLPVTTTLIAYAQYDNLVVVEAYHTVTFDYNMLCWASNFRRPSGGSPWGLGCWSMCTPGMMTGPCCMVPGCLPDQNASWWGCWGTQGGRFPWGLAACRVLWFLQDHTAGVCLPTVVEHGLLGHMVQYENATGAILEVLRTLRFLFPGHVQLGCALGSHYRRILGIQLCLQWGPDTF